MVVESKGETIRVLLDVLKGLSGKREHLLTVGGVYRQAMPLLLVVGGYSCRSGS